MRELVSQHRNMVIRLVYLMIIIVVYLSIIIYMFIQVLSEERRLHHDFGKEYDAYRCHTRRF